MPNTPTDVKRRLYLSLIIPIRTYCSPVWRPSLVSDFVAIEQFQRRATKYILHDYSSDYFARLSSLKLLPLMYRLEMSDIMFFLSSLRHPTPQFNIMDHFSFCSSKTRSSSHSKLRHKFPSSSSSHHSFFTRFPRLWNYLPTIDVKESLTAIKKELDQFFISHFQANFGPTNHHTFHIICPLLSISHDSFYLLFVCNLSRFNYCSLLLIYVYVCLSVWGLDQFLPSFRSISSFFEFFFLLSCLFSLVLSCKSLLLLT